MPQDRLDFPEFSQVAFDLWDEMAEWWDDKIGDGNEAQDEFIDPTTLRLLQPEPGHTILDIACGSGRMARHLADAGAKVIAFDQTVNFLKRAESKSAGYGD
ncbi:MAG: methyltransferase domain-containing protein, partial [Dehalococcoidia bacterium]